ncbi:ABC transporter ATP-binding protein [Bombilactobacillus bombi]|uniref:ABC transporter ATP-binding protein n=1 Tax=Bombilactobacillus bombi TaxID=1303590 RepID=UPI0015E61AC5|nr:ABC transporter ATP-binding protein [Bombilactobacillus bombi]MBA1433825.1 ABC transporter ATP-binding protein [Bombilactobacillus bombi]
MLQIKNLVVNYGAIQAVKDVSLNINTGEIVALIGANGAGKTTIVKTISGLLKPTSGSILYEQKNLQQKKAPEIVAAGIAQVPEGRHIFAGLSVAENLQMGAFLRRNRKSITDSLQEVYQRFPILKQRQNQDAATLSGGEQQMLAMARALMSQPKLLLLDEPSMGLAPIFIQEIFDIVQAIQKQGTTVLLIEQNARQALAIANRAYVLAAGHVTISGTGQELLANPAVQKAYLGG